MRSSNNVPVTFSIKLPVEIDTLLLFEVPSVFAPIELHFPSRKSIREEILAADASTLSIPPSSTIDTLELVFVTV